jgi:hypothetical protein
MAKAQRYSHKEINTIQVKHFSKNQTCLTQFSQAAISAKGIVEL